MPQSTWYLNNVNYAANLDGTKAMKIDISACNALTTDDYAVELWFKSQQTGSATLFSAIEGNDDCVEMGFNADGALTLTSKGTETEMTATNLRDNAWHHLALNVLRNGNATVYVDGQAVKSVSASVVSALAGANLVVGAKALGGSSLSNYFNGSVDEVRFWKATLSGDYIKRYKNVRLNGDEAGLVAYYPFEAQHFNEYQQSVVDETAADQSTVYNASTKVYHKTGRTATMSSGDVAFNGTDVPGLKPAPQLTNLGYTFVANERSIIITLTDKAEVLEGTTVDFTVRYATDKNYNQQADIHWTAYVKQNQLLWKGDTEVSVEKMVGETATFEATIVNESGQSENWSLSGLPAWLTASATSGTLKATMTKNITFTVSDGLAIGKYEQTVYLTGNNNIAEPLTLNLKVEGEEPLWTVNASDYTETMNVFGSLKVLDIVSQDEDDIVGAFINDECRGVAHLAYNDRYDGYFVTMDIYGNSSDKNTPLTFKVFDASAGIIYPVVNTSLNDAAVTIKYKANDIKGSYKTPVVFNATDEIEQNIELAKGWNWISFGVKPDEMTTSVVFANAAGRTTTVKGSEDSDEYNATDDNWAFGMAMNNKEMYLVQAAEDFTLNVTGHRVNPANEPITLTGGWNWIAYNGQQVVSLADALGGIQPGDGDVIKGQRGVAYFDEYEWIGSLRTLTPGNGYKYKNTADDLTLCYPASTAGIAGARMAYDETAAPTVFSPVNYRNYPANMVLIAKVVRNGMPVAGAELGVFAGREFSPSDSECREAAMTDSKGMVIITVPGDAATKLTFRVADGGDVYYASETVSYKTDDVVGTPRAPFVIELGNATGIDTVTAESQQTVYDLQGRKVRTDDKSRKLRKGVYIVNGQKQVK